MEERGEIEWDRQICIMVRFVQLAATMPTVHGGSDIPSTILVQRVAFLDGSDPFHHLCFGEETPLDDREILRCNFAPHSQGSKGTLSG